MARRSSNKGKAALDVAAVNFQSGFKVVEQHPMFAPLLAHARVVREEGNLCTDGWAVVTTNGYLHVHPKRRAQPEEWIYVLAHCLLHLGFGHFQKRSRPMEWNVACDCFVAKFLADLKLGRPPPEFYYPIEFSVRREESLYEELCERGVPKHLRGFGTAGPQANDMIFAPDWRGRAFWMGLFGEGLARAVYSAVSVAAGREPFLGAEKQHLTAAQRAKAWFISSYPLLGSLAATFDIVEDPVICNRVSVSIAAVDAESKEIFINSAAGLTDQELRFVMAHELLHVGLRHDARRQGRDPYLWNVACDFAINGWLVEMGMGQLPQVGTLYDLQFKGESAEAIYDRVVTDMRRFRKLATLRGVDMCDMLERGIPDWWAIGDGIDLDDFYRRSLSQGLVYHEEQGRGSLPAGLVEEIRALSQPPIQWDVELAKWFDEHFSALEKVRTYARPSRRQSASPDIPLPRWVPAGGAEDGRTFGVVLDTSGSMDRSLLAKALGAMASYSFSRDVPGVRVVFCDAATYDQGYMSPEAIADRVKVRGRGGTVLQPGIELLENAEDFPKDGPILIITDGYCDRLTIRREHAFLIPQGRHLPFVPKGPVFRIK